MAELPDLIAQVQQELGALISKPKLSTKLLSKPPFRFLHDIIFAVMRETGYTDGIYEEHELVGKTMKDRQVKIDFLTKVIGYISQTLGEEIDVRPTKIVAGLEPECTCTLLLALVRAATGGGGGADRDESKDREDSGAAEEAAAAAAAAAAAEEERQRAQEEAQRREAEQREADRRRREQEEADAKARDAAAAAAAASSGGKDAEADSEFDLNGELVVDGTIERTQGLMSQLIAKPKMSVKLLSKPPFRFLHDVVTAVARETGFGEGLFLEGEDNPKAIKDRHVKVQVLQKALDLVGIHLGVHVNAKPAKIVAGMEPELTNEFLQLLAYAAVRGDGSASVDAVLNGQHMPAGDDEAESAAHEEPAQRERHADRDEADARERERELQRQREAAEQQQQRERERAEAERQRQEQEAEAAAQRAREQAAQQQAQPNWDELESKQRPEDAPGGAGAGAGVGVQDMGMRRLQRPTTAGRRPPRVRDNAQEVKPAPNAAQVSGTAVGIMKEGEDSDSDEEETPAFSMGAPETKMAEFGSAPAAGAGGGAGKLTRDILAQEQKQSQEATAEEDKPRARGIKMGRIGGGDKAGGFSQLEVDKLRTFIQKLCQSTNPLGKCMDYLHEDMDMMKSELTSWTAEFKKRKQMLEETRDSNKEALAPLERELKESDQRIEEQTMKINSVKATIARNDERIQELLRMVVSW